MWQFFFVALFSLLSGAIFEQPPRWEALDWNTWASLLYLGIACTALALLFQNIGQQKLPPSTASLLLSLESPFGVAFSVAFGAEVLTGRMVLSLIHILGSGWKFGACAIGFILNYAAYFAEIYRSGIQSIPVGHYEAAEVLGYSRAQTFFYIVLPQVIKRILPAMGNEIITLVKDTSLAFVLGIAEMFTEAKALAASFVSMIPYVIAAVIYWIFTLVVEFVLNKAEKKLAYYHD